MMTQEAASFILGLVGLAIIFAIGGAFIFHSLKQHLVSKPKRLRLMGLILSSDDSVNEWIEFFNFISSLSGSIVLEYAAQAIGDTANLYIAVPHGVYTAVRKKIGSLWRDAKIYEVDHYNIYNHHGSTIGVVLKKRGKSLDSPPKGVSFEAVNEIGEGAIIQLITRYHKKEGLIEFNLRAVASTPSPEQTNEVLKGLTRAFGDFSVTAPKNQSHFFNQVNIREFDDKEASKISSADLGKLWAATLG